MVNQYILYVQDTETTGFVPGKHEIIEISFRRFIIDDNKPQVEQRTWKIRAYNAEAIEEEALAVNGHKREDILWQTQYGKDNYLKPEAALIEIEAWINSDDMSAHDRVFAGQNPMFDFEHMVALWTKYDSIDTFPFVNGHNKLIIDTKSIALFLDICLGVKRERYNLSSLIKFFGVKKLKAHNAEEDTVMTADLLTVFINGVKGSLSDAFKSFYKDRSNI